MIASANSDFHILESPVAAGKRSSEPAAVAGKVSIANSGTCL